MLKPQYTEVSFRETKREGKATGNEGVHSKEGGTTAICIEAGERNEGGTTAIEPGAGVGLCGRSGWWWEDSVVEWRRHTWRLFTVGSTAARESGGRRLGHHDSGMLMIWHRYGITTSRLRHAHDQLWPELGATSGAHGP